MGYKVLVDHRESEQSKTLLRKLQKLEGVEVEVMPNMPVGDLIVGDFLVEHKEVSDFMASIYDGRLFRQAKELSETGVQPVLILHGDIFETLSWVRGDANRSHHSYLSALATLARMGIPVIPARSDEEFVQVVLDLVKQADPNRPASDRPITLRKADRTVAETSSDILCALPGVGRDKADALLQALGSPAGVAAASLERLEGVLGKGKRARAVYRAFRGLDPDDSE